MKKIHLRLDDEEYEEFKDFLYSMVYCDIPIVNNYIAELILKKIEDEE